MAFIFTSCIISYIIASAIEFFLLLLLLSFLSHSVAQVELAWMTKEFQKNLQSGVYSERKSEKLKWNHIFLCFAQNVWKSWKIFQALSHQKKVGALVRSRYSQQYFLVKAKVLPNSTFTDALNKNWQKHGLWVTTVYSLNCSYEIAFSDFFDIGLGAAEKLGRKCSSDLNINQFSRELSSHQSFSDCSNIFYQNFIIFLLLSAVFFWSFIWNAHTRGRRKN